MKKLLQLNQISIKNRPKSDQHRPNIGPKSVQNRFRRLQNRSKICPWSGQNPPKTQWQQGTQEHLRASLYFCPKCRQHGRNLGPQNEPKSLKKRFNNRFIFRLLLGATLIPKIIPKPTPRTLTMVLYLVPASVNQLPGYIVKINPEC